MMVSRLHTLYCRGSVNHNNSISITVKIEIIMTLSTFSVSGPVRNLLYEVIPQPEGSVRISWVAPAVTNGDIVSYEVTYGVLHGTGMKLTVSNLSVVLTNLSESIQV